MAQRYARSERFFAWSLVAAQMLLLAAILLLPGSRTWSVGPVLVVLVLTAVLLGAIMIGLAALALGGGLTASPLPSSHAHLRTSGVYACVRHPIYTGLLLGGAGIVVASGRLSRAVAWVLLVVLLSAKARWEERRLSERFTDYPEYAARTPRLLPRPSTCLAALRRPRH